MDKPLGKTPVKKPTCIKDNIIQASLKEDPGGRDDTSSLPNPMDRGACWAAVHGVAKSNMTGRLHFHFHFQNKDNLSRSDKKLGMGEEGKIKLQCWDNLRNHFSSIFANDSEQIMLKLLANQWYETCWRRYEIFFIEIIILF